MPVLIMMVGIPGCGKSTWANRHKAANLSDDFVTISTDDIFEAVGKMYGYTYNELFQNLPYFQAEKIAHHVAQMSFDRGRNIIWDQTNLTKKTRARKLSMVPEGYKKECVVFGVPEDLDQRLASRPGKTIPDEVISRMMESFEMPTMDEGFHRIVCPTSMMIDHLRGM